MPFSVTVSGVTSGSWIYVGIGGENSTSPSTLNGTTEHAGIASNGWVLAHVGANTVGNSGSISVGWNATDVWTSVAALEIKSQSQAATPTSSPNPSTWEQYVSGVTLSCTSPSPTIRYTTDGSTPTGSSTVYSGALSFTTTTLLQAICQSSGLSDSAVMSNTYWISAGAVGRLGKRPTAASQ